MNLLIPRFYSVLGVGAVQTEHRQDPGTSEAGRQGPERRGESRNINIIFSQK